ncbi:36208_t:CDS:1, partial [Racocetra persica]
IEEVIQDISRPDYPYKNYVLPKKANSTDRAKYNLCQDILKYQQENNISEAKLIKIFG